MRAVVDTLGNGAQGTDAPYLFALCLLLLLVPLATYAETYADSPDFTLNTTDLPATIGGAIQADSSDFTVNTVTSASLSLTINGGGSVLRNPNQTNFAYNSLVTLTAMPNLGWTFTGWFGDATGSANPVNLLMSTNRAVTATFASTVADLIVDNTNATFSGTWTTDTGSSGFYAIDFRYATTVASVTATATFRPTLPLTGNYDLFVWFPNIMPNNQRCGDAQYFISASTSNQTVSVSQDGGGSGTWHLIAAAWKFDAGTNGFVRLWNQSTDTGRKVAADAVRWVWSTSQTSFAPPQLIITGIARSPSNATVTWQSISNEIYRLKYKTNLTDAAWLNVSGDVTATANTASKTDNSLGNAPRRFYRVEQLP